MTFRSARRLHIFRENATPLSKIDESSKLLRYVTTVDRHPDGGPRNVTFQSARRRQIFRNRNSSQYNRRIKARCARKGRSTGSFLKVTLSRKRQPTSKVQILKPATQVNRPQNLQPKQPTSKFQFLKPATQVNRPQNLQPRSIDFKLSISEACSPSQPTPKSASEVNRLPDFYF